LGATKDLTALVLIFADGDGGLGFKFLRTSHTRRGVAGISMWRNPKRRWRASTIALMTAGGAPTAPASPAPLTPSGLAVEGTLWVEKAKNGTSSARGRA
jgi:hypothetical protein